MVAGTLIFLAALPGDHGPAVAEPPTRRLLGALADPSIRVIALTTLPAGFCVGTIEVALPAFSDARGTPALAGVLLALWSLASGAGGLVFGARPARRGLVETFLLIAALFPLACLPLVAADSVFAMAALVMLAGVPLAPLIASRNELVGALAPAGASAESFTWLLTALLAGAALGTGAAGRDRRGRGMAAGGARRLRRRRARGDARLRRPRRPAGRRGARLSRRPTGRRAILGRVIGSRGRLTLSTVLLAGCAALAGCAGSEPDGEAEVAAAPPSPVAAAAPGKCPRNVHRSLECAEITVPLERADPELGSTRVRYAVRRHTDRSRPPLAPIFAVEGGPGYGSIGGARYYIELFGPLLRRRDLVLTDLRGTGHSRALDCRDLQTGRGPDWIATSACARSLGPARDAYRTAAGADDLDDVRRALRYPRIDLYGDSYGTFLSQSYAFRHGDRLRALVLDSAYPVRGESAWYPSLHRTAVRALGIACERSPGCDGDARERLERMVERLREQGFGVGGLLDALASAGYSPPGTYRDLDRAIAAYLGGDTEPFRRLTAPGRPGFGSERYYSAGLELAVSCNDYPMLWDKQASEPERRRRLERAIRRHPEDAFAPFTPREIALDSDVGYLECLGWPPPGDLYEPPADPDAQAPDVPTLVIAGELDNVTSPAEGRAVAAEFPDSRFVLIRNAGHVPSLYADLYPAAARVRGFLRRNG